MAIPTFDEATTKFTAAVAILDDTYVDADGLLTHLEAYEISVKADAEQSVRAAAAVAALRSSINSVLASPEAILAPLLTGIARSSVVNFQGTNPQEQIDAISKYMAANSKRVKSRVFTFGAFTAGSPHQGDGTFEVVTKDENGFDLEALQPDVWKFTCDQDQSTPVPKGQERWAVEGQAFVDHLEYYRSGRGSGRRDFLTSKNGASSLLNNASFYSRGGSDTIPTSITNWLSSVTVDATNYQFSTANYYHEDANENGTPKSLQVNVTATLTQYLRPSTTAGTNVANASIDYKAPYHYSSAINASVGAAIGTLVLHMGSKSKTVLVNGGVLVATVNGAGNVDAGTHSYYYTYTLAGVESGYSPTSNVITAAGGGSSVDLTAIPLGPAGSTNRKIYRKIAGNTGNPLLLTTIADNTTTTYTDNTADSGLGAAVTTTSHSGWFIGKLPTTNQSDLWPKNWMQNDASVKLVWTRTAGTLLLDTVRFFKMPAVLNKRGLPALFVAPLSGRTPWMKDDIGTITNTETGAKNQRWLERAFGRGLPHATGGSITWADPA